MTTSRAVLTQAYLTPGRAAQYRTFSTEAVLAAQAGDWTQAEAVLAGEEDRELRAACTAAERHGIQQFSTRGSGRPTW